jgi:Endonuclease NucS C-terminal domain
MQKQDIQSLFSSFLTNYDPEAKDATWEKQSKQFRDFWEIKIMPGGKEELNELETDQIIKILDRHGKGNTKESEAVARAMIAQGAWRRMFNDIKNNKDLSTLLNQVFLETDTSRKAAVIDKVYKLNEGRRNNLTGQSGNAVNAMLFAWNPQTNVSVISLKDRRKAIEYFGFEKNVNFEKDSVGKKIVQSNADILNGFKNSGINYSPRTVSCFLYAPGIKDMWKTEAEEEGPPWGGDKVPVAQLEQEISDPSLFYMESQLEDFLIENWDRTELGRKYDLIVEEGELQSQQYSTGIGRIDILAQDKKTKQYVVIELKKGQSSDDTVGQITRYMGWLEDHKTGGKPTKGIIIAAQYDERLYYALKKLKDIEVYLYKVDFKLQEFKEQAFKKMERSSNQ